MLGKPINLELWLKDNTEKLQPPVNNFCLYRTNDYTVMVVGGPNKRSDYHVNPTEEFFYQHQGDMLLKVVDDGEFKDVVIKQGDLFMLPANIPHNPVRFANTVGLVIEIPRPATKNDALVWYCSNPTGCKQVVYKEEFYCVDLGIQLKPVIQAWDKDVGRRVCAKCGFQNPTVADG